MKITSLLFPVLLVLPLLFFGNTLLGQDTFSTIEPEKNLPFSASNSGADLDRARIKLIPYPQNIIWLDDKVVVESLRVIDFSKLSFSLSEELKRLSSTNQIKLSESAAYTLKFLRDVSLAEEGYKLRVDQGGIEISSSSESGDFYALQTLSQLIRLENGKSTIEKVEVHDWPAYPIRGYMIDVGRNFMDMDVLKEQLDILAKYKMNVFHWHLTDGPAWRIESLKYPELTASENHLASRDPGKYYTYEEIRELISYANDRKITVIPEIDMPGHSESFRKAMGFAMESEQGMLTLETIMEEFFEQTPKDLIPMVHIGSDEVRISNAEEFITRMVSFVEKNGRKAIIWSPGLVAKNSVIRQTWGSADAVQGDYLEIDSRRSYINSGEPMTQVNRLLFKPIGADSNNETIGGILCLWPDVNINRQIDAFRQNPVYSSILTYAWSTWTADITSSPLEYRSQVPPQDTEAGKYFKAFEAYLIDHKQRYFQDLPFHYRTQSDKIWEVIGPFNENEGDSLLNKSKSETITYNGVKMKWTPLVGNTLIFRQRWGEGGIYPDVMTDQTAYAKTYIHSDEDKEVDVWINFETPTRSNRVYTGIGKRGQWDPNGSMIYVNGENLPGPNWKNPGWKTVRTIGWGLPLEQEIPWEDEELYWLRAPKKVSLNKGWNSILVKIPSKSDFQNWMFTFVPLDMTGLTFSLNQKIPKSK